MLKIRLKNLQKAQGMVEFALVLPILLLVILGIIAFGHLFFVYSSVVSASREAARWGAAVGEAPNSSPRYQDCTSIRAAAVRLGSFAGVTPNTVTINYDHGPVNPPNAPVIFASCPLAGTGPDSTQVNRGDRIVVRVTVQYTPIVPFVNLPSFPLSAESGRTIVKSLPIGDAPVAEDPCTTDTTLNVEAVPASTVGKTGQTINFNVTVTAVNGATPTGSVLYSDLDGHSYGPTVLSGGKATFPVVFDTAGTKTVSIRYEPDNVCFMSKAKPNMEYVVARADTSLSIVHPVTTTGTGIPLYVSVQLAVTTPGNKTPAGPQGGPVTISLTRASGSGKTCTATLDANLVAGCYVTPNVVGSETITATYAGDANFNGSSASVSHTVIPPSTATFLPTPTTAAPTEAPFCPTFTTSYLDLASPATSFTVGLRNRDVYDLKISRVIVSWPSSGQTSRLDQIRFSDSSGVANTCRNNNQSQCIWWANNNNQALYNGNPLTVTSSTTGNWSNSNPGIARNATRYLRLVFTTDLAQQGPYYLEVEFVNSQGRTCRTSPVINYNR